MPKTLTIIGNKLIVFIFLLLKGSTSIYKTAIFSDYYILFKKNFAEILFA